ncbi:unnamed protein product [Ectocarpus sp. 12 AP-2014]
MKTPPGPASFSFVCFFAKPSLNVPIFSVFRDAGGQLALQPCVCVCVLLSFCAIFVSLCMNVCVFFE